MHMMSAFFFFFFCRMSPPGERENAALRQCVQARAQLEEAIAGVVKAEALLRGNSREVRGFKYVLSPLPSWHMKQILSFLKILPLFYFCIVQRLFFSPSSVGGFSISPPSLTHHWLRGILCFLL